MIKRHKTKRIHIGKLAVGGTAPIAIQSMTKTDTRDVRATVAQIRQLTAAGCHLIRLAVKDRQSARALRSIKKKISIPLIADIHFSKDLALEAMANGADKIRLNPGNISRDDDLRQILKAARKRKIPIRIGINSGSLPSAARTRLRSESLAAVMVNALAGYVRRVESFGFNSLVLSMKASRVPETIAAYRAVARRFSYPLHVGLTATGLPENGVVKSSIAIGTLLTEGIGDTIRVSLTGDPLQEVICARKILESLGLSRGGIEVISCPTCGRCGVDLERIVRRLEDRLRTVSSVRPMTVAVMGCEVNGPGEARDADIGIAAGRGTGILFRKGRPVRRVPEREFVTAILSCLRPLRDQKS